MVLNNAVVNNANAHIGIEMGMRVLKARLSMGGPPGMSNCRIEFQMTREDGALQFFQFTRLFGKKELSVMNTDYTG